LTTGVGGINGVETIRRGHQGWRDVAAWPCPGCRTASRPPWRNSRVACPGRPKKRGPNG